MNTQSAPPPVCIVIFGASGDLTKRKLAPAIHSLACAGHLHPRSCVVGVGRRSLTNEAFRERLFEGIQAYARVKHDPKLCNLWPGLETQFEYVSMDTGDASAFARLAELLADPRIAEPTHGNLLFYLATPPDAVHGIIEGLRASKLARAASGLARAASGWRRIVLEKPFGVDLSSAIHLNEAIHNVFDESQVLRIDHYLGKETVQNILALRFANSIFEPIWNRNYVDHIQITVAESLGVGSRAGYYDQAGVLRDIVQNHMLQLLALIAMEPPSSATPRAFRNEKAKLLQAVRPPSSADVVLGQYRGYLDEPEVADASNTPTYMAIRLLIDNWRWQGVPVYLRSGKCMAEKTTEVTLEFREVPHRLFPETTPAANRLSLHLQPDEGAQLQFEAKVPGAGMRTQPVDMVFRYADEFGDSALPDAYERLLLEAISGDPSLFIRNDEIELSWGIVESILHNDIPPRAYEPGSWGPVEAEGLFEGPDRAWLSRCSSAKK